MDGEVTLTVGTFDGVHLGHRRILDRVNRKAREQGGESVAYVFERPPRLALAPEPPPCLLLPIALREAMLRAAVDRVVLVRFADVRRLSPREFVERIIVGELNARGVVVGEGFRFGQHREGDVQALRTLGEEFRFQVESVSPVVSDGQPVSSTRIRHLLREGHVEDAAGLLGRPPVLVGNVIEGEQIGRTLGHPTANLSLDPQVLLPADGIYFAHVFANDRRDHGLLYVGERPTLVSNDRRCEVRTLTPPERDLYGTTLEVHVLARLRDDRAFPSLDALRAQIDLDVVAASDLVPRFPFSTDPIRG
ncbi:MAG: riboflavin biosynthesis protein RibF [Candidatus Bipolaricaulia bacterium]